MFSLSTLQNQMESVILKHATQFRDALATQRGAGEIDIQEWFQSSTFDTICEICFGDSPNALEDSLKGNKPKFLKAFDIAQCVLAMRNLSHPLLWKTMRMLNVGSERTAARNLTICHEHLQGVVDRRKAQLAANPESDRADLLSLYINFSKSLGLDYIAEDAYLKDVVLNVSFINIRVIFQH
jgi:cytochrome P450